MPGVHIEQNNTISVTERRGEVRVNYEGMVLTMNRKRFREFVTHLMEAEITMGPNSHYPPE
jgi:hypothetical protein